jgi:hypothetical protein
MSHTVQTTIQQDIVDNRLAINDLDVVLQAGRAKLCAVKEHRSIRIVLPAGRPPVRGRGRAPEPPDGGDRRESAGGTSQPLRAGRRGLRRRRRRWAFRPDAALVRRNPARDEREGVRRASRTCVGRMELFAIETQPSFLQVHGTSLANARPTGRTYLTRANFCTRFPSYVSVMNRSPFELIARLCAP